MFHDLKRVTLQGAERGNVPRNSVTGYMQGELYAVGFELEWRAFGPVFLCPMMAKLNAWISSGERGCEPVMVFCFPVWLH